MALIAMAVYDTDENGRQEYTKSTLSSLMFDNDIDWGRHRLFVVNNNSCKITSAFLDGLIHNHSYLNVINLPENVGTAKAINKAWSYRKPGEHLIKMDNDVVVYKKGWVDDMEEVLNIGDRNGLLIAARILAYGKDYSFKYTNPNTNEEEIVHIDLQTLKYKELDWSLFSNKNEFDFVLPHSKNTVTFKLLTLTDDKKIDEEIKGMKKMVGQEAGSISTKLKHQIMSVNGEYSTKTVRDFIDQGYLLSRDSIELRRHIESVTPDIDLSINFTLKDGTEVKTDLPMTAEFFFP